MWVVQLENVTKRHRATKAGTSNVREAMSFGRHRAERRAARGKARPAALNDVSFSIEQGSAVALVGANGAGKTTALRLMSRIISPSEGRVRVRGRVGALLEVSSGVHPELSGRENIWLYGSIIGIPRAEIRRRFDDIVEFSELRASIDRQAKFYSSGMQLRLGFAIATFLEPQVLLVDESLATADLNFQLKCIDRLSTLVRNGTTLLFVSHELAAIETLCTRGLLLERGMLVHDGTAHDTLVEYKRRLAAARAPHADVDAGESPIRLIDTACVDVHGAPATGLHTGDDVVVQVTIECREDGLRPVLDLRVSDLLLGDLIVCSSSEQEPPAALGKGIHQVSCRLASVPLRPRQYAVTVGARDIGQSVADPSATQVAQFRIEETDERLDLAASLLAGGPLHTSRSWEWHSP